MKKSLIVLAFLLAGCATVSEETEFKRAEARAEAKDYAQSCLDRGNKVIAHRSPVRSTRDLDCVTPSQYERLMRQAAFTSY